MPRSSYPRAQHSRWATIVRLCLVWLVVAGGMVAADDGIGSQTYTFDIPSQSADSALTEFAEQADLTLVFPDELVRDRTANALIGEYSLEEGAAILLEGTGLIPSFSNPIVLNIMIDDTSSSGERAMNATKKAGLVAIIAGTLAGGVEAQEPTVTETEIQTSVVTGTVTDARTGANLRGAKITIEETGQWTSTGDLGRFRFNNVPQGSVTLIVSNLGYVVQSVLITVGDSVVSRDFALRGGNEIEEIVVFGQRSARAQALNQERTAPNVSTVVSSDLLGNFPGTTISEALRRVPGVSFQQDPGTGDGTNIIIRGVEPDLNTVTLNGVELPVGNGVGRSASLNNILADSLSSITISKTLLPSQDAAGTGGIVAIETKSPLDRPRRFARFLLEGAQRGEDFRDDVLVSGTVSGRFGTSDKFGISGSVQYRDRSISSINASPDIFFGEYLPLEADGSTAIRSLRDIDPRRTFPFESEADGVYVSAIGVSEAEIPVEDLAVTLSAEWQPFEQTNLRFDYTVSRSEREEFRTFYSFRDESGYEELPVIAEGGEIRRALNWSGDVRLSSDYLQLRADDETNVFSFQGETNLGLWELSYNAGYTEGQRETLQSSFGLRSSIRSIEPSLVLPDATDSSEGRVITLFGKRTDGVQVPLLTQQGFDLLNDPENFTLGSARLGRPFMGENSRSTAGFSVRRNFEKSRIKYLEAGVHYESSEFRTRPVGTQGTTVVFGFGVDAASLGLTLAELPLSRVGTSTGLNSISLDSAAAFVPTIPSLIGQPGFFGGVINSDPRNSQTYTIEDEWAGYLQTAIELGNFEIIGGFRIVSVDVEARNRTQATIVDEFGNFDDAFAEENTTLFDQSARETDILPRVLVNYRPQENLVLRGGYYLSVARPQIELLSDERRVELNLEGTGGPNGNQPDLEVRLGNPALRPSTTQNFDFSAEYYDDNIGVIKVGAFYKSIDNFIQSNGFVPSSELAGIPLPDDSRFEDLPSDLFVNITQPGNADGSAEIWGLELAVERQFTFLPSAWGGLGVFANYTYTDSSREIPITWNAPVFDALGALVDREQRIVEFPDERFEQQPHHSGTFAFTYNKYGIDGTLAYTYQDRLPGSLLGNGLRTSTEEFDTLDLRLEYLAETRVGQYRVYFEGLNLMNGTDDVSRGTSFFSDAADFSVPAESRYSGGREFRIGLIAVF